MNQLKQYLQSFWRRPSPDTPALRHELDAIREAHATANAILEKAQEDLRRAGEADAQLLAELQQQLRRIDSERAHAREQIEHLERSLGDVEQRQKSEAGRMDSLDTRLKDEVSSARDQLARIEGLLADAEKHRKATDARVDSLQTNLEEERTGTRDQMVQLQRLLADAEQRQKSEAGRVDSLETTLREHVSSARHQVADVQGLLADAEQRQKSAEGRMDSLETRLKEEVSSAGDQLTHVAGLLADVEQSQKSTEGRVDSLQTELEEERGSTRDQVAHVQRMLADTEHQLKSAEAHMVALESRLDEERSRHEASLHATETGLARFRDEQHSLLARQGELTNNFRGIATRLQELQQVANAKRQQSRLLPAAIAAVLLVAGVLAGVFIVQSLQDRSQELTVLEQDVRDMRVFMKERIDNQDAALNDLALALNRPVMGEQQPAVEVAPTQAIDTQVADENATESETFTPDIREVQAGLIELGYDLGIPQPNGELGVKTRQALQEFRQFYLTDSDAPDDMISEPLVALILKSGDMARADAARFNVRRDVLAAIRLGSIRTGVDFSFLMELARVESNFNPAARAPRSSATGLFQFRDHGWLESIRTFGADYGLQDYATRVTVIDDGISEQERIVRDPLQLEVLALRLNPRLSTLMMAESIKRNLRILSDRTGQEPGRTDLYLAHFLGADGAVMLLGKLDEDPAAIAADLFPQEAENNPKVFQDQRQQPRTVADVYRRFESRFNTARYVPDFD